MEIPFCLPWAPILLMILHILWITCVILSIWLSFYCFVSVINIFAVHFFPWVGYCFPLKKCPWPVWQAVLGSLLDVVGCTTHRAFPYLGIRWRSAPLGTSANSSVAGDFLEQGWATFCQLRAALYHFCVAEGRMIIKTCRRNITCPQYTDLFCNSSLFHFSSMKVYIKLASLS